MIYIYIYIYIYIHTAVHWCLYQCGALHQSARKTVILDMLCIRAKHSFPPKHTHTHTHCTKNTHTYILMLMHTQVGWMLQPPGTQALAARAMFAGTEKFTSLALNVDLTAGPTMAVGGRAFRWVCCLCVCMCVHSWLVSEWVCNHARTCRFAPFDQWCACDRDTLQEPSRWSSCMCPWYVIECARVSVHVHHLLLTLCVFRAYVYIRSRTHIRTDHNAYIHAGWTRSDFTLLLSTWSWISEQLQKCNSYTNLQVCWF